MPNTTKATRSRRNAIYHIRNWPAYDRALVQRGSLTVWMSDDALQAWQYQGPAQRGAQFDYSDQAIEAMWTLKEVFHLSNRQTEGLVRSLFELMQVALSVPDHSTLSRRAKTVQLRLPKRCQGRNGLSTKARSKMSTFSQWKCPLAGVMWVSAMSRESTGHPRRRHWV